MVLLPRIRNPNSQEIKRLLTRTRKSVLPRLPPRPKRRPKRQQLVQNVNVENVKRRKSLLERDKTTLVMPKWCNRIKLPTRSGPRLII